MRKPNPLSIPETASQNDVYAGAQLRAARQALGWSQSKLGETAGISFQQVQKYERGINRIAFSTLQAFAAALNLPIEHFLPDVPVSAAFASPTRTTYAASNEPDAAELLRLYESLQDDDTRKMLLQLARELNAAGKKAKKA